MHNFSNHGINDFVLLFWKCVCPYDYMDDWVKFNETSLSDKEDFYSYLNMEDITNVDYWHTRRVCNFF